MRVIYVCDIMIHLATAKDVHGSHSNINSTSSSIVGHILDDFAGNIHIAFRVEDASTVYSRGVRVHISICRHSYISRRHENSTAVATGSMVRIHQPLGIDTHISADFINASAAPESRSVRDHMCNRNGHCSPGTVNPTAAQVSGVGAIRCEIGVNFVVCSDRLIAGHGHIPNRPDSASIATGSNVPVHFARYVNITLLVVDSSTTIE